MAFVLLEISLKSPAIVISEYEYNLRPDRNPLSVILIVIVGSEMNGPCYPEERGKRTFELFETEPISNSRGSWHFQLTTSFGFKTITSCA
jgi:hypothetical protein